MHRRLLPLLLLLATPLAAHTVPSLQNGSFDDYTGFILPWAVDNASVHSFNLRMVDDANGSPSSRAAEIGIDPESEFRRTYMYECVQIDPKKHYEAGVRIFIPPDLREGTVRGALAVRWFNNSECNGDHLSRFLPVVAVSKTGVWVNARLEDLPVPNGATHMAFAIEVWRTYDKGGPEPRVRFDDAYLSAVGEVLTIPAVASQRGASNSDWSSDLYLINQSTAPLRVTLVYRCLAFGTCNMRPREVILPAEDSVLYPDVVGTLFESPNSGGAVEIFADDAAGQLVATSRLNSRAPRGTFGAEVRALRDVDFAHRAIFPGIRNGPGFRTNLGIYNPDDFDAEVVVSLHENRKELARSTIDVPSRTLVQVNIFHALGLSHLTTDNAYLRIDAVYRSVAAFVSVIDNATNDVAFSNGVRQP